MISTGIIVAGGDLLCQTVIEGKRFTSKANPVSYNRLGRAFLVGSLVICPNLYLWYNKLLPRIMSIPALAKVPALGKTLIGTAIDQLVVAWWIIGNFFFFSNFFEVGPS